MLDTDSKDLVTVHTDGNEQLSVMSYGPGMEITADSVSPPVHTLSLSVYPAQLVFMCRRNICCGASTSTYTFYFILLPIIFLSSFILFRW